MNNYQKTALENHCRFAFETAQAKFAHQLGPVSVIVTVNSGYE